METAVSLARGQVVKGSESEVKPFRLLAIVPGGRGRGKVRLVKSAILRWLVDRQSRGDAYLTPRVTRTKVLSSILTPTLKGRPTERPAVECSGNIGDSIWTRHLTSEKARELLLELAMLMEGVVHGGIVEINYDGKGWLVTSEAKPADKNTQGG